MTRNKAGLAVIGTGMVSGIHLQSIADLSDFVHLSGVLSRTPDAARAFAQKAKKTCGYDIEIYPTIDEICSDQNVDFVLILTPPNARMGFVERLARNGKSILMEKPMERTSMAARRIVEICETHNVQLGVVFQHRVRVASRKLAQLRTDGALGDLVFAEARVPWWRDQSYYDETGRGTYDRDGGGVLISQAIHTLDLMLSFTGQVIEVQAMAHTTALHDMEAEDHVTAALRFENGAVGSLIATTANFPGEAESLTLHFTNAVAKLKAGVLTLNWRDGRAQRFGETTTTGGGADPMAFTHEWHRDVILDFVEALRHDRAPLVTGRIALKVQELIDAMIRSSNEKRTVVLAHQGEGEKWQND